MKIDWKKYFPAEPEQREETYEECVARMRSAKSRLTHQERREKYGEVEADWSEWDELRAMYPREV